MNVDEALYQIQKFRGRTLVNPAHFLHTVGLALADEVNRLQAIVDQPVKCSECGKEGNHD